MWSSVSHMHTHTHLQVVRPDHTLFFSSGVWDTVWVFDIQQPRIWYAASLPQSHAHGTMSPHYKFCKGPYDPKCTRVMEVSSEYVNLVIVGLAIQARRCSDTRRTTRRSQGTEGLPLTICLGLLTAWVRWGKSEKKKEENIGCCACCCSLNLRIWSLS